MIFVKPLKLVGITLSTVILELELSNAEALSSIPNIFTPAFSKSRVIVDNSSDKSYWLTHRLLLLRTKLISRDFPYIVLEYNLLYIYFVDGRLVYCILMFS